MRGSPWHRSPTDRGGRGRGDTEPHLVRRRKRRTTGAGSRARAGYAEDTVRPRDVPGGRHMRLHCCGCVDRQGLHRRLDDRLLGGRTRPGACQRVHQEAERCSRHDVAVRGRTAPRHGRGTHAAGVRLRQRGAGAVAGGGCHSALHRGIRCLGLRDAAGSRPVRALLLLGPHRPDRLRDHDDLREHPGRCTDLGDPRPGHLRLLDGLRLPAAAPVEHRQRRGAHRPRHLPRRLQRVPVLPADLRRGRQEGA